MSRPPNDVAGCFGCLLWIAVAGAVSALAILASRLPL